MEHICRVVEVAGVDHVAVATDYDETWTEEMRIAQLKSIARRTRRSTRTCSGTSAWEERRAIGMDDAADFPNITEALLAGGFSPEDVIKILGGNWLRVYGEAWKPAAR